MVWFGDCFSLLIQSCAVDVVIHLRTDIVTNPEPRRTDIQFLAGICNRLGRYHTSFSWQANLYARVEHGPLCFRSLNFSLWSSLRFLQDNKCLHGNVAFVPVAVWPETQSLRCLRSTLARLPEVMLLLLSLSSVVASCFFSRRCYGSCEFVLWRRASVLTGFVPPDRKVPLRVHV